MKCCKCYIDITDHVFKNKDYELCKECVEAFIKAPSVVFNEVLAYANTYRSSSGKNNVIECFVNFLGLIPWIFNLSVMVHLNYTLNVPFVHF